MNECVVYPQADFYKQVAVYMGLEGMGAVWGVVKRQFTLELIGAQSCTYSRTCQKLLNMTCPKNTACYCFAEHWTMNSLTPVSTVCFRDCIGVGSFLSLEVLISCFLAYMSSLQHGFCRGGHLFKEKCDIMQLNVSFSPCHHQCAFEQDLSQQLEERSCSPGGVSGACSKMYRQDSWESEDCVVPSVPTTIRRAPSLGDLSDESSIGKLMCVSSYKRFGVYQL